VIQIKNRWNGSVIREVDTADLRGADLCGADLCEADLCEADLYGADLCGADLCGADLYGADLRGADLCGADLRGADLRGANLCEADLRGANLCEADLRGANLCEADLCEAKNIPPIEVVPDFKKKILNQIGSEGCSLNMSTWHTCETTHCLAGWATTLHPQGRLLESLVGAKTAGALIFNACCGEIPSFYSSDEAAVEWLNKEPA
jgi:hypothetical protein